MRSVTKEVQEALRLNGERHKWTVAAVRKAGSFAKGTSLRCSHDLDILVELNVIDASSSSFDQCRHECLELVHQRLTRPGSATPGAAPAAACGWCCSLLSPGAWPSAAHYYLRLWHPKYKLQLDVQDLSSGPGGAAPAAASGPPLMQAAAGLDAYVGVATSADVVLPPAYIWEIFVLFVLERQQAKEVLYDPAKPLQLFIDVMDAASQLLRQGSVEPVVVSLYYSEAEAKCCESLWGGVGLCTPYIINPVDPTYNCTAHHSFCDWNTVADEARDLHSGLLAACKLSQQQYRIMGDAAEYGSSWVQLVEGSSLCRARAAFLEFASSGGAQV
eukprot:gene3773-4032_t